MINKVVECERMLMRRKRGEPKNMEEDVLKKLELDDSGNYSSSSINCDGIENDTNKAKEEHQALLLALQDVRKLRSELERLHKSEQWYKQELRKQKNTRLESLERLYSQERKYMNENQRLQKECLRLYGKCGDLELELEKQQKSAHVEKINPKTKQSPVRDIKHLESSLKLDSHEEQQQIIDLLRQQKSTLLSNLHQLSLEKDAKVLELQKTLASMELENQRITLQCKQMLEDRTKMSSCLESKELDLIQLKSEQQKLLNNISQLREQLAEQQHVVQSKEMEIESLRLQFEHKLNTESNMDKVHELSMFYNKNIHLKSMEISSLKNSMLQLQAELLSLNDLQDQTEEQQRIIEQLNFSLNATELELKEMQQNDMAKQLQVKELQDNLLTYSAEKDEALGQLHKSENHLKSLESQIIKLNAQYANMCSLCERSKFELQLRDIEEKKLKFQAESDKRETDILREKLREYLQQTAKLSESINSLEFELQQREAAKMVLAQKLKKAQLQIVEYETTVGIQQSDGELCKTLPLNTLHKFVELDCEEHSSCSTVNAPELEIEYKDLVANKKNHIENLQKLLKEQNEKIQGIRAAEDEWQQILQSINSAQQLHDIFHEELVTKSRDFEELNHLFQEQNNNYEALQDEAVFLEFKNLKEIQLLKSNTEKIMYKDEELLAQIAAQKNQIRQLKAQNIKLSTEYQHNFETMQEMQTELSELKANKRQALLLPEFVIMKDQNEIKPKDDPIPLNHLRMLQKVMEYEQNRKMQRYDAHIRSLLRNVKSLKKSLKLSEAKCLNLSTREEDLSAELQEYYNTRSKLQEVQHKYEQSIKIIQELEYTLAEERQKYESSQQELETVPNLIDDYKKLIQQSATRTGRSKTSAILDLIQRSNQCVPNFHKLDVSVQQLQSDIQNIIDNSSNKTIVPSLMDELQAALQNY